MWAHERFEEILRRDSARIAKIKGAMQSWPNDLALARILAG